MGRLQHPEIIVGLIRSLVFDIFLPCLIRHVAARRNLVTTRPISTPVALPQVGSSDKAAFMKALSFTNRATLDNDICGGIPISRCT